MLVQAGNRRLRPGNFYLLSFRRRVAGAAPIFLLLAIPAIIVRLLTKSAHVALDRREVLVAEICRISGDTASTARDS